MEQARWLDGLAGPGGARTAALVVTDGMIVTVQVPAVDRAGALRMAAWVIEELVGEPERVLGRAVVARVDQVGGVR